MHGPTRDRPDRSQENRCPAQGSRRRDPASAADAGCRQKQYVRQKSGSRLAAARKRTSAEPGKSFPVRCTNGHAWANEFPLLETPDRRLADSGASCEVLPCTSQTRRACSVCHCEQIFASARDRIDQESTPEQKC